MSTYMYMMEGASEAHLVRRPVYVMIGLYDLPGLIMGLF